MAENLEGQSAQQRAETQEKAKTAGKGVEGERRSFAENGEGGPPGLKVAHRTAEAAKRLVETGRPSEWAELWRAPFESLPAMQMEMNRMFEDFWRGAMGLSGLPSMRAPRPFAGLTPAGLFSQPPADVIETDKAYSLALEIPGLTVNDLDIAIEGDSLVVCGHKAEERKDATTTWRVSERRFGRFERRFPIAADIDREAISASYKDGVLRIELPRTNKPETARSKIAIKG